VSESAGVFGWARRALGASSDLDRNEFVLAGAYLPVSVVGETWRTRARFTLALARRAGGPASCCAASIGTIRVRVDSDGTLWIDPLGALARVVTPTTLTPTDVSFVAAARLAGASSSANDGVAVNDLEGRWWVLVPTPDASKHLLQALAGRGWNVVPSMVTYQLRLFDRLSVTTPPRASPLQ
jgi:hypothetical protein